MISYPVVDRIDIRRNALDQDSKFATPPPLDIKGCICHFTKWQIHPFISKVTKWQAASFTVLFYDHPVGPDGSFGPVVAWN